MADPLFNFATPRAALRNSATLFASAVLAASGAWTRSSIVAVDGARRIVLLITYTTNATSGTGGFAEIVPMVAYVDTAPGAADATWFPLPYAAATVTEAVLASGTLPTGTDFTGSPNFAQVTMLPLAIRTDVADNDTDVVQMAIPLDITGAQHFQLMAHEAGDTTNMGTLAISYAVVA